MLSVIGHCWFVYHYYAQYHCHHSVTFVFFFLAIKINISDRQILMSGVGLQAFRSHGWVF